jgi:hypothetical protein
MLGASRAALIGVERIPDPFYASTSLIAQFEGSDAATSSTDQSPVGNTLTFAGNAELDTAQIGLGVSSLLLPGSSGDYVGLPSHVSLELGGDFTIEFYDADWRDKRGTTQVTAQCSRIYRSSFLCRSRR